MGSVARTGVSGHRRDIQGLRAIAVLMVIADHAGTGWLSGGFVGVDIFFVLSGYLITSLLLREGASTGRVNIADFYARRARRILPAATLVLLVTLAYAASELSLARVQRLRDDAVWSALFAANIHFSRIGTDYFEQGRDPSPFQHYWSLAVEEQFYLVWPVLLALVLVLIGRRGGDPAACRRALTWLLVGIVVVSLAWSVLRTEATPGTAYYSSAGRGWELAVGALVAVLQPAAMSLRPWMRECLCGLGLVALAAAAVTFDAGAAFPGWRALVPVLGTAAIVAAGAGGSSAASLVLGVPVLVWVGNLSFSLYLWHWPFLVLGPGHADFLAGTAGTWLLLALTLAVSVMTYHLVENPFRRARRLRTGHRALALWPLALGAVVIGVVAAERHATTMFQERLAGTTAQPVIDDPPNRAGRERKVRTRDLEPSLGDRMTEALRVADSGAQVPFPLTNYPTAKEEPFRLPEWCRAEGVETSTKVCTIGDRKARDSMVVLGDSQAGQWLPAIDLLGRRNGFRVLPLIKLGCPPFDVPVVDGAGADFWQCTAFREWASAYIADERPDVVLVASEATSHRLRPEPGHDLAETLAGGVHSTLQRLHRPEVPLVVLADTPDLAFDPVDCLTDPDARLDDCVGVPHDGLKAANANTRKVARSTGAGYVDTVGLLCVDGRCPLVVDRTMTFGDYSHISPTWSAALVDDLERLYLRAIHEIQADPRHLQLRKLVAGERGKESPPSDGGR